MRWRLTTACLGLVATLSGTSGCGLRQEPLFGHRSPPEHYKCMATEIEYPDVDTCSKPEALLTAAPRLIGTAAPTAAEYKPMSLEEAIQTALQNSQSFKDLGGRLLTAPAAVNTIYEPAIRETDARFGTEAALSQFDAQLEASIFWAKNDRPVNNTFFGADARILEQDTGNGRFQVSKRGATGTQYAVRNLTNYDYNNAPGNLFSSAWDVQYEAEVRHPLLQGGGLEFNRIAGPNATPGFLGTAGVLVARINTDIALSDFEIGVRNLVSDVENAYWELYFAYRDLDAKIAGRNASLETWRRVKALYDAGRAGGEADKEAQAREQYFLFEAQVQNALAGTPGRGTISGNGSTGGVFQGAGGVYASERRLRFLMGYTATDPLLVRPNDEPSAARIVYQWEEILPEALAQREELRRQKWTIKRRELELVAARNFLLPRLDLVGLYRWRGFGDHLIDHENENNGAFDNAYGNLTHGNFQEWQMGFQYTQAIGFRQAMSAVRNAEIQLTRERAVLRDQELEVSHELSNAVAELDRTYVLTQTNFNRRVAAQQQLSAVESTYENGTATLDLLLDAQRRLAEADVAYYRALVEYSLALKNLQLEKGTLLAYNGIFLNEGPWPGKAYCDARQLADRMVPSRIDYHNPALGRVAKPGLITLGGYPQNTLDGQGAFGGEVIIEQTPTEAYPVDGIPTPPADMAPSPLDSSAQLPPPPHSSVVTEYTTASPVAQPSQYPVAGQGEGPLFSSSRRSPAPVQHREVELPAAPLPDMPAGPAPRVELPPAPEPTYLEAARLPSQARPAAPARAAGPVRLTSGQTVELPEAPLPGELVPSRLRSQGPAPKPQAKSAAKGLELAPEPPADAMFPETGLPSTRQTARRTTADTELKIVPR